MEHKRIILVTFSDWWWADMQMKIFKHHETLWRSDSYCWLILRWSGNEKWWRYLNYAYRSLLHCTYIWLCQVTYKIFHRLLWQTQNDGHSSNSFRCFFVDSWYIFRLKSFQCLTVFWFVLDLWIIGQQVLLPHPHLHNNDVSVSAGRAARAGTQRKWCKRKKRRGNRDHLEKEKPVCAS